MAFVLNRTPDGPPYLTEDTLGLPVRHGFFTAEGGVSTGIYASLNCGFGSDDDAQRVAENRARAASALGLEATRLACLYQVHSADAVTVDTPSPADRNQWIHADGLVTTTPGLGLAILTADCLPLLLADPAAGVIGACHAGWRGAAAGIVGATISRMQAAGANAIIALIGPTIRQPNYQVDAKMRDEVIACNPGKPDAVAACFVADADAPGKFRFDLPGFVHRQAAACGVTQIFDCGEDTYAPARPESPSFFSYRRATHADAADSGRQIAIIALAPAAEKDTDTTPA